MAVAYRLRKMLSRDVCDVLDIAHEAEQECCTEQDVHEYMSTQHSAGFVAVDGDGNVIGYILFRDAKRFILVEALAVSWVHSALERMKTMEPLVCL